MFDITVNVTISKNQILRFAEDCVKYLIFDSENFNYDCEDNIMLLAGVKQSEIVENLASWDVFLNDVSNFIKRETPYLLIGDGISSWPMEDFLNSAKFIKTKEWKDLFSCLLMMQDILEDAIDSPIKDDPDVVCAMHLLQQNGYDVIKTRKNH